MKYQHRFQIKAPLAQVADFHQCSASMAAITPPPTRVEIHQAPERLQAGDEMTFTLWLGSFPIPWRARIDPVTPTGFVDRQVVGPFQHWTHRHLFIPLDENTTTVVDHVEASLRWHPLWGLVGLGMWLSLPLLFAYRGWKTRRLLENLEEEQSCNRSL